MNPRRPAIRPGLGVRILVGMGLLALIAPAWADPSGIRYDARTHTYTNVATHGVPKASPPPSAGPARTSRDPDFVEYTLSPARPSASSPTASTTAPPASTGAVAPRSAASRGDDFEAAYAAMYANDAYAFPGYGYGAYGYGAYGYGAYGYGRGWRGTGVGYVTPYPSSFVVGGAYGIHGGSPYNGYTFSRSTGPLPAPSYRVYLPGLGVVPNYNLGPGFGTGCTFGTLRAGGWRR
jgi:hypothetical protein